MSAHLAEASVLANPPLLAVRGITPASTCEDQQLGGYSTTQTHVVTNWAVVARVIDFAGVRAATRWAAAAALLVGDPELLRPTATEGELELSSLPRTA